MPILGCSGSNTATALFDGAGQRVADKSAAGLNVMAYDAGGALAREPRIITGAPVRQTAPQWAAAEPSRERRSTMTDTTSFECLAKFRPPVGPRIRVLVFTALPLSSAVSF
jgi:hypothetical protein